MTSKGGELPAGKVDRTVPLLNLSAVRSRMDSLQRFLSESVNSNTLIGKDQMDMVSAEISSAIHQIILNGAALLASATPAATILQPSDPPDPVVLKVEDDEDQDDQDEDQGAMDCEVVEIDAVELLAEHVHFCEICGKGFKRDANLRMHMRAHGNQYKTPEALAKPQVLASSETSAFGTGRTTTKFSCPYDGCNRNRKHKKFRPLKSVICVRNHFKRSHCPKMYSCNRCNKKSFSVVADLKSHLKHCGESKWKCTCGTSFSRKDKLFGHMALFEGHMPAVAVDEEENNNDNNRNSNNKVKAEEKVVMMKVEEEEEGGLLDNNMGFFDGLLDGFDSIDGFNFQEVLESPNYYGGNRWGGGGGGGGGIEGFYGGGVGL